MTLFMLIMMMMKTVYVAKMASRSKAGANKPMWMFMKIKLMSMRMSTMKTMMKTMSMKMASRKAGANKPMRRWNYLNRSEIKWLARLGRRFFCIKHLPFC